MKSKVFYAEVNDSEDVKGAALSVRKLLDASRVLDTVQKGDKVAVKAHFGEKGNTGYVRPEFMRPICDGIKAKGGMPFISDTNTLYKGMRTNSADHTKLAHEHGFTVEVTGAQVVIPDDTVTGNTASVALGAKYIKTAKIARIYADSNAIVTVSHFKGHMLSGFGGAIKNLGMGCATREGKLAQHNDLSPTMYEESCVGCQACVKVCPTGALKMSGKKAKLEKSKCIGCANCVGVCSSFAIFVDMGAGSAVQEKMAEYALAVMKGKKGKACFVNFAVKINKECDCWGAENPRIGPDVGIFASTDPVAVDQACYDAIVKKCGKDIFKDSHPDQDANVQLKYAEELGLGHRGYELIGI